MISFFELVSLLLLKELGLSFRFVPNDKRAVTSNVFVDNFNRLLFLACDPCVNTFLSP